MDATDTTDLELKTHDWKIPEPTICTVRPFKYTTIRLYSVVVITFGFDPNNPGSNPGTTYFFYFFFVTVTSLYEEVIQTNEPPFMLYKVAALALIYSINMKCTS